MLAQCKELFVNLGEKMLDQRKRKKKKKKQPHFLSSNFPVKRETYRKVQQYEPPHETNYSLHRHLAALCFKKLKPEADTSSTGTPFFIEDHFQNPERMGTINCSKIERKLFASVAKENFCLKSREVHKQSQIPCAHSPQSVKLSIFHQA